MKIILVLYNGGDSYYAVKSDGDLTEIMRKLWEDKYNECLAEGRKLSEGDSWFEEDQAQIVGMSGEYIAEYRILKVREM